MNRFFSMKTERRELPEGEDWVEFRRLNYGDKCEREDATMRFLQKNETGQLFIATGSIRLLEMKMAVVAWSFTDESGPVPVTEESLKRLDFETARWIEEQILEMNPGLRNNPTPAQGEVLKNSPTPSDASSMTGGSKKKTAKTN